jgi:hypothetical protein
MRWRKSSTTVAFLTAVVLTGLLVVGIPTLGASAATCQSWGAQPPSVGSDNNLLQGVAVTSACNAWAVGWYYSGNLQTLVEHWNGTA